MRKAHKMEYDAIIIGHVLNLKYSNYEHFGSDIWSFMWITQSSDGN